MDTFQKKLLQFSRTFAFSSSKQGKEASRKDHTHLRMMSRLECLGARPDVLRCNGCFAAVLCLHAKTRQQNKAASFE